MEVGSAQARDLRVGVRMDAPGQQRVVGEVETRHEVRGAEATCSVSAKKSSGLRFRTSRPTGMIGTSSSGTIFVASSTSKLNPSACSSVKICRPSSYSGYAPASMASQRSRRW